MPEADRDTDAPVLLAGDALRVADDGGPRLVGIACADCGARAFPPAPVCSDCMSEDVREIELSRDGSLYAFSVVHVAPAGWNTPYIAGYVDLPEGVRVFAHIVGADAAALEMDSPVRLTTATLGTAGDGAPVESYAFRPAGGAMEAA